MKFNTEQFEAAFIDLLAKYRPRFAVIAFADDEGIAVRAAGLNHPSCDAGCHVLYQRIDDAVKDCHEEVLTAMLTQGDS